MERPHVRIGLVNPSTLALAVGLLAAVAGFGVSVAAWSSEALTFSAVVDTVLRGLQFGFSPGLLAVIVTTILYYLAGWVLGYVQGALFNWVAAANDGLEVAVKETRAETKAEAETAQPEAASPARPRRAEPTFGETIGRRRDDL